MKLADILARHETEFTLYRHFMCGFMDQFEVTDAETWLESRMNEVEEAEDQYIDPFKVFGCKGWLKRNLEYDQAEYDEWRLEEKENQDQYSAERFNWKP